MLASTLLARLIVPLEPLADDFEIITRDELLRAHRELGAGWVESVLLPAVVAFLQQYVRAHGWFYPPEQEGLDEALADLARVEPAMEAAPSPRAGTSFLKSLFRSYWEVLDGPVRSFENELVLIAVIRYRLGLNHSKLYTYQLESGETVQAHETFPLTLSQVRRGFVVQRRSVSFFKPGTAASLYARWLEGKENPCVWDPSSGFGARLLGFWAVAPDGTYIGNEPATRTREDLLRLAARHPHRKVHIHATGAEHQHIEPGSLDLVLTSLPYFNLEKYFDEPGQCWKEYPTYELWCARFLRPVLRTAVRGLKEDGYIVINVDQPRRQAVYDNARLLGLELVEEQTLNLSADHYARARGRSAVRTEPILVFHKGVAHYPLWDKVSDPRETEVWTPLSADPDYLVSSFGRCVSMKKGAQLLRGHQSHSGYVSFSHLGLAHGLVLRAFTGDPPPDKPEVRHLDGNKANNRLDNLAWGDRIDQQADEHRNREARRRTRYVAQKEELTAAEVEVGLRLYEKGRATLDDLAEVWRCSSTRARAIVLGESFAFLSRDMEKIEARMGRTGSKHHLTHLRESDVHRALQSYVDESWSGADFAKSLGISQGTAHQILSGRTWTHVPRPEGLVYPRPDASVFKANTGELHPQAKLTEARVAAIFEQIVADAYETMTDVMQDLGLTKGPAWALLNGKAWADVPRPVGFDEAVLRLKARGNKARGAR